MATRRSTPRRLAVSASDQYGSLADWKASFLPNSSLGESAGRREDPEQLASRLVKESLDAIRPKVGI
jgi:hypothetical protein